MTVRIFWVAYVMVGFIYFWPLLVLFPWEDWGRPAGPIGRFLGSLAQAMLWPLGIMAWAALKFEVRRDR